MRIGFIGAGKVGCSLGKYLKESAGDWQIEGYFSRCTESAKEAAVFTDSRVIDQVELLAQMANVIFITTPDGAISEKIMMISQEIGLSLEAKVLLFAEGEEYDFLKENESILAEIFIVSAVEVQPNRRNEDAEVEIGVRVEKAPGQKCERCWMYSETVGKDHNHPTLCKRCVDNLE